MRQDRLGAKARADRPLRVVLIGAAAEVPQSTFEIVGVYADSAPQLRDGVEYLGRQMDAGADLGAALLRLGAEAVLWAAAPQNRALARDVLRQASDRACAVYIAEQDGPRPLQLEDLFPADASDDTLLHAAVAGKRVLITGGGGSIGGELARRIATLGPAALAVVDISEFNIFALMQTPALVAAGCDAMMCDITDLAEMRAVCARVRPQIVFHAAALKHVPLVERHPCRGAKVNVVGTRTVAQASAECGADLVFVSTDKAVAPKGVMGATKRLAGLYCRARDVAARGAHGPRAIVVRLGNVLGSAGSVSQIFEQQAQAGGPITLTDPRAERYFITLKQAADSLLRAAAIGLAPFAPRGAAYTLDMGAPAPILDLAHDVIRLAGRRVDIDTKIEIVGLRSGEKLTERLVADEETTTCTLSPSVHAVHGPLPPLAVVEAQIDEVAALARATDGEGVRRALAAALAQHTDIWAQKRAV